MSSSLHHFSERDSAPEVWQPLEQLLSTTSPEQLQRWEQELQRRLKENGSTYRSLPDGPDLRDWQMDPIPMLLSEAEWQRLGPAIQDRAARVERLLADLMGPQIQVKRRAYHPELLFSDPDYLLAAHASVPKTAWLSFVAMDIGRTAQGDWAVFGDVTRPPAGLGYVLERRINLARVFGFLTRQLGMRRLTGFMDAFRDTLNQMSGSTHAVLLTPGQHHPSYFEHAFLANYLDLTLAQGEDLTVREGKLWLKTLDGLQPVSAILRRVLDSFSDPLNFRDDSRLGTPGMQAAVRSGEVKMMNPPGAGLVDSPGFLSQLDLAMPGALRSAQTLPLIEKANLELAMADPQQYIFRALGGIGRDGLLLDHGDPMLAEIARHPGYWVAQERLSGSLVPAIQQGKSTDVAAFVRVYAIKTSTGWSAMPGGLVRFIEPAKVSELQASARAAAGLKDLWVLGGQNEQAGLAVTSSAKPTVVNSQPGAVPSRVADALFWMGRYSERLDFVGRLLREILQRVVEERQRISGESTIPGVPMLLGGVVFGSRQVDETKSEAQLGSVLTQADHPVGLHTALSGLLANARSVPDYLSPDAWRLLVRLEKKWSGGAGTGRSARWPANRASRSDADAAQCQQRINQRHDDAIVGVSVFGHWSPLGARFADLSFGPRCSPGISTQRPRPVGISVGGDRYGHDLQAPLSSRHSCGCGGGYVVVG